MESRIESWLRWSKENIVFVIISVLIIILIGSIPVILYLKDVKVEDTVTISPPEISQDDKNLKIGKVLKSDVVFKVTNGAKLSVDASKEVFGLVAGLNKNTALLNDLKDIVEEGLTQKATGETKEFTIPANAWCEADLLDIGCASYKWVENSKNCFKEPLEPIQYKVVVIQSMAIYITYKNVGFDAVVYEIEQ